MQQWIDQAGDEPAEDDPVGQFAEWLRRLHRSANKPPYKDIVRRIQEHDPTTTVAISTVSEIFNGKRIPRWSTVEPIARVLGGADAVRECGRRWQLADAARTSPPSPVAPAQDAHRTWSSMPARVITGGLTVVVIISIALAAMNHVDSEDGPAARSEPSAPTPPPPPGPVILEPGHAEVSLDVGQRARTADGAVTIRVGMIGSGSGGRDRASVGISTSTVSCPEPYLRPGDSLLTATPGGGWTQVTLTAVKTVDLGPGEPPLLPGGPVPRNLDMLAQLQVNQGSGAPPKVQEPIGGQSCP